MRPTAAPMRTTAAGQRLRRGRDSGSMLVEVSVAMGLLAVLALIVMKASLLALSNNQWTIMQTLTDAYLTRETALSHRVPMADLIVANSQWPDSAVDDPPQNEQTVTLGKLPGGKVVSAKLIRFRVNETAADNTDTGLSVWRLHSLLTYKIGDDEYVKSRATLRMQ